jgi:actinorhodin biosynthesis protein ActVIA
MSTTAVGSGLDTALLYAEVMQHHAVQMQALDALRFEDYAATFTEDGVFRHTPGREPARGRGGIVADLVEFHERVANDPVQRRHWFSMLAIKVLDDGAVQADFYTLVVTVRPEQKPVLAPSCTVRDILVRAEDGRLLNRSRWVEHDRVAALAP